MTPEVLMDSSQASRGFSLLLTLLDPEPETAPVKYIELREKLVRILLWKGCPEVAADSLSDAVLDRIATKLAGGEEVKDLSAYSAGVLRFVWLEYSRKSKEDATDDLPEAALTDDLAEDPDQRLSCLRKCMIEICKSDVDRRLIVGYYDTKTADEKNKEARRILAQALGFSATALRVRACRLRDKLENCINKCVAV
jgi:hypothetical protein